MDSIPKEAKKSSSESSPGDTAPLNDDSDRGGGETDVFPVGDSSSQPSPRMSSRSSFASQASPASKEDARGAGAGVAAGLGFAAGRRAAGRAAEAPREPVPAFWCVVRVDGNLSALSRRW